MIKKKTKTFDNNIETIMLNNIFDDTFGIMNIKLSFKSTQLLYPKRFIESTYLQNV